MRIVWILALTGALSLAPGPLLAQDDLSVDDIVERLNAQQDAFTTVRTRGLGGGAARGLEIVEIDDLNLDETGAQVTGEAATDSSGTVTTAETAASTEAADETGAERQTATTVTTAITDPNKPLEYGKFVPELQINVRIEFGFDSAALDESQNPKLEKMCLALQRSPVEKVRIVGHTDARGTPEYNERLSVLRAEAVARHLIEDCGIAAARLEPVGLGERFLYNETEPEAGENRRVEFQAMS